MGNEITVNGLTFDDSRILSGSCNLTASLTGDELAADTLEVELDWSEELATVFQPSGASSLETEEGTRYALRPYLRQMGDGMEGLTCGAEVEYSYHGTLVGKFYLTRVERTGKYTYALSCTSTVGLLANSKHYGGIYAGAQMSTVLSDIIGDVAEYSLSPAFESLAVYGWLPVASRRDNLHQLLFATGASIRKTASGTLEVTALNSDIYAALPDDRIFLGGSVEYQTPPTKVVVCEHAYTADGTAEYETLFEGEVSSETLTTPGGVVVSGALVLFEEPMHSLTAVGAEILESNPNYAVISPAVSCTLKGKPYNHTVRQLTRQKQGSARSLATVTENEITVSDATLVSLANSENVALRMLAYFGEARAVKVDMAVQGERPGDAVAFLDPFDEEAKGFIKSMDIELSGTLKAQAELAVGYEPPAAGNNYQNSTVLTAGSTWTAPAGTEKVRIVLVGSGADGTAGTDGASGERGKETNYGTSPISGKLEYSASGGEGGKGGKGGAGGKVYIATVDVTPGTSYSVTGAGGEISFAGRSSADGEQSAAGYTDIFSGAVYGLPGRDGIDGGAGCGAGVEAPIVVGRDGKTYRPGARGKEGSGYHASPGGGYFYNSRMGGGEGGGAADGANGANGGNAFNNSYGGTNVYDVGSGAGGKGANGSSGADGSTYGCGGSGGSGGGGGGAGGPFQVNGNMQPGNRGGEGGAGGKGGTGGKGKPGCVIIYY